MPDHNRLANSTQLVLRHLARVREPLLVIDPPDAGTVGVFPASTAFLIRDFAVFRAIRNGMKLQARFAPWLVDADRFAQAIIFLPKGKDLLDMTLMIARSAVDPEGAIWLVGGKREGIASAARPLERAIGKAEKIESARHSCLYSARLTRGRMTFDMVEWLRSWKLESATGPPLTIATLPGVFSHGRLDEGTRRLLQHLHLPPGGRVLDLGCGAGVIGATLAAACPACKVEMTDASALAVEASRRTIEANHIANAIVYPSDVFSSIEGVFDFIVSNPPFHHHVQTDYRFHQELVSGARSRLRRGGILQIVVNRFLKLEPLLAEAFGSVTIDFEDRKYRVYRAIKP